MSSPSLTIGIAIAIATMRRWSFLKDSLPMYLGRPEVTEVIVCDETGEDYEAIQKSAFANHPKLRLFKNERRLGIYENKLKAASLATAPWIAVLDSDNLFDDEWFATLHTITFDTNIIIASADFKNLNTSTGEVSYPCKQFSGLRLTKTTWNEVLKKPRWNFLLNDGNWIIPKGAVGTLDSNEKSSNWEAADAIYMLRCFVLAGYSVYYAPGLEYTHIVHPGSSWLQTDAVSSKILVSTDWRI
jgi:glycosyltransferase involved in cell wall biosynthesis